MSDIKPIPTRYAGCHFRSRLEARWAVFFDALDIRWLYEPQGFDIDGTWYLPDFYLPRHRLWVEVKGSEEAVDLPFLIRAAIPHEGLPADPEGNAPDDPSRCGFRILILGPVPQADEGPRCFTDRPDVHLWVLPAHVVLHFWKGDVTSGLATFVGKDDIELTQVDFLLGNDSGDVTRIDGEYPSVTNSGAAIGLEARPDVIAAYRAARSARFEHGQSGAT